MPPKDLPRSLADARRCLQANDACVTVAELIGQTADQTIVLASAAPIVNARRKAGRTLL
jgi:hypothetical protein